MCLSSRDPSWSWFTLLIETKRSHKQLVCHSDKRIGLIKVVIKHPRVQWSCVRFPASSLNQIKKQLCYNQFREGIKYIHTQPTNSLIKKSSIYFNVFLIRYELRIKNRIQTDIWNKLSFKIRIIRLFSWFYFVKDRKYFTNHLIYPTDIIIIL